MQELWRWTYLNRSLRKQPISMTSARVMEVDIPEQNLRKQPISMTSARVMEVDIPEQKFEEATNKYDHCKSYGGGHT